MTEKYNGWTNYETWCINLWIGNERGSYEAWTERAAECWAAAEAPSANARFTGHEPFTREERATLGLAKCLKEQFEEDNPLADQASCWSDLMGAALSEVDWHSIAEHMIEDVDKSPSFGE